MLSTKRKVGGSNAILCSQDVKMSLGKKLNLRWPPTAVPTLSEGCVIEEVLCIEELKECVFEWVKATCTVKVL